MRCYRIKRAFLFKIMGRLRKKEKPFGTAPNDLLNDKNISFKAKGLFCFIDSKPDNWEFSESRIASQSKDGISSVRSGLKELIDSGYLERNEFRSSEGYIKTEYILHWHPIKNPTLDNPTYENPTLDNRMHISKKEYSKNDFSNKEGSFMQTTISNLSEDEKVFFDLWSKFKGKRNTFEKDFKNFYKKTKDLDIDFNYLFKNIDKSKNIYFQSWINNLIPKATLKKTKRFGKAEFRKVLIENYNCDAQHVDDWMEVRDKHKAAYTKTSLRAIVNECIKNDYPVKKAIEACASNSWRGFKYAWIENLNNSNKPKFNKPNNDFIINR